MPHLIISIPAYILTEQQIEDLLSSADDVATNLQDESDCAELAPMVKGLKQERQRRGRKAMGYKP